MPPHADHTIPDTAPDTSRAWPEIETNHATTVALVDKDVGRCAMQKLQDLGLDDKTLVIFASQKGANQEFIPLGNPGGLRGYKNLLYEGGLRSPFIVLWPGQIKPDTTSDQFTTFVDFLPTAADPTEARNIAAGRPHIVNKIEAVMAAEHVNSPYFPAPEQSRTDEAKKTKKAKKTRRWRKC